MKQFLSLLFFALSTAPSFSQTKNDTDIIGIWKGESICQIKTSPCHNEHAVYHVTKMKKPNMFQFVMNKMVNRKEEDMGILEYTYDAKEQTLTCVDEQHHGVWKFIINDSTMDGTATFKGELYRIIHLKKE